MNKRGFTLIELLVVIAIIGVLAGIAIPTYVGMTRKSARSEAYANLQNLRLLEEQSFADKGAYTISLGTAGKDHSGNVALIRAGGSPADPSNALPRFQPGSGLSYSYNILTNKQITDPTTNPPTTADLNPCFVAYAYGNTGTRVDGDVFVIDCNNNRNF